MEPKWWHNSVVYQIYPKSFNDTTGNGVGDLRGIIDKLDYLEKLGVDVIWLSPVYRSPMRDNGYDISDYRDIDPLFGNLQDLDELIREGSARGIRLIMDLVVNHTSDRHPWFLESRESKNNPYRDYYIWRDAPDDMKSVFGGSAWQYDERTGQYYFHQYAGEQPDLNWENPQVRDEVHAMMNWWLGRGIGGFRMDVIDLIGKEVDKQVTANGPRLHSLLQEMNEASFGTCDVLTVGETWGATPETAELYSDPRRRELSMIFQFEHMTLDWGELGKWTPLQLDVIALKRVLSKWQTELVNGWNSLFWNNHDLPRIVSRWGDDGAYRIESAKLFAILLHLMKGTPYIYQGEEIGMTNMRFGSLTEYDDVEIHGAHRELVEEEQRLSHDEFMQAVYRMGRDNARTPMQWNAAVDAGFTSGKPWLPVNPNHTCINVQQALEDETSVFYTYQRLIELRRKSVYRDTIVYGDYQLLLPDHDRIFAYRRYDDCREIIVVANISDAKVRLSFPLDGARLLLSNYPDRPGAVPVLRPYEAVVFVRSRTMRWAIRLDRPR